MVIMTGLRPYLNESPKTVSRKGHLNNDFRQWAQGSKYQYLRWRYAHDQCLLLTQGGHRLASLECRPGGPKDDLAASTPAKGPAANHYDTAQIACANLLRINAAIAISRYLGTVLVIGSRKQRT